MRKVGADKAKIRSRIEKTGNFIGIGGVYNFSSEDHSGLTEQDVVMVRIVDGQWMLLK